MPYYPVIAFLAVASLATACGREPKTPPAAEAPATANDTAIAAVDALLDVDRQYSRQAAGREFVDALSAMMDADVVTAVPPGVWADGAAGWRTATVANPANTGARVEWFPIRGGISGDGLHGFTYGYLTVHPRDSAAIEMKYLSYWVKGPQGWRVAAYRRGRRAAGPIDSTLRPPSLPSRIVAPTGDAGVIADLVVSLRQAEQAFSDAAQKIGLGPAFRTFGAPDAMNMGGPASASFVFGPDDIAAVVADSIPSSPSSVVWNADRVIIASSGDLGITVGVIHEKTDPNGRGFPFFTVWRRGGPDQPWRYVAE